MLLGGAPYRQSAAGTHHHVGFEGAVEHPDQVGPALFPLLFTYDFELSERRRGAMQVDAEQPRS
jgi:hypothetical protein